LVFITINLYNFILCILNNLKKNIFKNNHRGFYRRNISVGIGSSCHSHRQIYRWIYSVDISHSPTTLPTDLIRRYLTVLATMTNECTDGYLRLVFQTLTDNFTDGMYPSVCHTITDGINSSVYFKRKLFFCTQFSSVKPSANVFFMLLTDVATNGGITNERKADRRILSVRTSVNKLPKNS
jgi:hypothetical protein